MAYNILIVDDSAVTRSVIRRSLGMTRLAVGEIFEAANGREALDLLGSSWIDIVFTDLNMPVMDGFQLVEELSQRSVIANTPVIVVSSNRDPRQMEALAERGVRAYLKKPFTPECLQNIIANLLGDKMEGTS